MTIDKAIFYGFSAWVGRIDGETRCGFWPVHPVTINFDPILLIPVDLSRTPSAALKGKIDWDEIQVDDFKDGTPKAGATTIGPLFPGGKTSGIVYLAKQYYDRLRADLRPPIKPQECINRVSTVVYGSDPKDPRAGSRYHSYQATIVANQEPNVLVSISPSGAGDVPAIQGLFNLSSAAEVDYHVDQGGLTEIAVGKQQTGLLYIEISYARSLALEPQKNPLSCGVITQARRRPAPRMASGAAR
jgi:hypothetical protein